MHAHVYGPAVLIQRKFRLAGIKIYTARIHPALSEQSGQLIHRIKLPVYMRISAFQLLIPVQQLVNILINQPLAGAYNALKEPVGADFALRRYMHFAAHGQPVHIGIKRAYAVAEPGGQHGNNAARKIYARPSP